MALKKSIIAIVYDFDGTLCPLPMQEYTVLPEIGIRAKKFWEEVKAENQKNRGEEIITYMMLMLKKANDAQIKITKKDLGKLASKITYFPGVAEFFGRINEFVKEESENKVKVRHYIISSGLKEILLKTPIKKEFHNIFASEYTYDHYNKAQYPKIVVTDTVKTQFLFRINKGKEDILESINEYMPDYERPVPFSQIIYIGDGMTDVPCMTLSIRNSGYAIAVYKPNSPKGVDICRKLFEAGRVDFIARADYRQNKELEKYIKIIISNIIKAISYNDIQIKMAKKFD